MPKFDTRNLKYLNSNDFLETPKKFFIIPFDGVEGHDCVTVEEKENKEGKKYNSFTLHVQEENHIKPKEIGFLFERDLANLIEAYGEDSEKWAGCLVEISAAKVGNYVNWVLKGVVKNA